LSKQYRGLAGPAQIPPGYQERLFLFRAERPGYGARSRCGAMLWDGNSKGTLNNIHNLLHEQKAVLVYLSPETAFHKLTKKTDLKNLLSRCDQEQVNCAQKTLQQSDASLHRRQMSLT
jgi:hypothetical protein